MFKKKLIKIFKRGIAQFQPPSDTVGSTSSNTRAELSRQPSDPSAAAAADPSASQERRRRRRERRRRRPSQESIVGLPIYSPEPDEDELVLVKPRTIDDVDYLDHHRISINGVQVRDSDGESDDDDSDDEGYFSQNRRSRTASNASRPRRRSEAERDEEGGTRSRRDRPSFFNQTSGNRQSSYSLRSLNQDPDRIRDARELPPSPYTPSLSSATVYQSSTSLHAARSNDTTNTETADGRYPTASGPSRSTRSRASTLRSIFQRNRSRSNVTSDSTDPDRDPYGPGNLGASVSSLSISAPLPHTLVSSNYVFPKKGLTPAQVAFIASRESLGTYGLGPGAEPPTWARESSDHLASRSGTPDPSRASMSSERPPYPILARSSSSPLQLELGYSAHATRSHAHSHTGEQGREGGPDVLLVAPTPRIGQGEMDARRRSFAMPGGWGE